MATTTTTTTASSTDDDDGYEAFLAGLRERFAATTAGGGPLFTTDAAGLYDAFLAGLPVERRPRYACSACRRFVDRYGGLVAVAPDGQAVSVMWDPAAVPPGFAESVRSVARLVAQARIDGVFLSDEATWGTPQNTTTRAPGVWRHMAVAPAPSLVFRPPLTQTASKVAAGRREDYGMLCRGLAEFPVEVVRQALSLLTAGALERSEKCEGVARWLLERHEARASRRGPAADNLTWLAAATAPAGYCHVRSGMIGTLLEDVAAGLPFEAVKRRFDEKMHPLRYMRPTAAPTDGNIAEAERVVAAMKAAGALGRRFARLEDVQALWKPVAAREPRVAEGAGVFGHLKGKRGKAAARPMAMPPVVMTFEKFRRTVLPGAEAIGFMVPARHGSFAALVTAADPEAPPMLQWDDPERRNPVSWYLYTEGRTAAEWNLPPGVFHPVTAIALQPSLWGGEAGFAHQGASVFFLLEGARDTTHVSGGGMFPEQLRAEFHGVRKTLEAHIRQATIAGTDEATACGLKFEKGGREWVGCHLRVTAGGTVVEYRLDRWD